MSSVWKAAIGPKRVTVIAGGPLFAVPTIVYWIACNPDAPNAWWILTDDLDGLGTPAYEHFDTDKHGDHIDFNPPLEFKIGLYVSTFSNMTSLIICYE